MTQPIVSVTELQFGPWGYQNNTNWRLTIGGKLALKEVTVSHGSIIDRLEFTIADESGNLSTTTVGGRGGGTVDKIVLKSDEYITMISGVDGMSPRYDDKRTISSLKIHTNLNPTGYGPYGKPHEANDTSNFSSPMPLYGRISGFIGRADKYLNSIGVLVTKRTEKLGPWGNEGPTNWSWTLKENETIKEIIINYGFIVDGIGFIIADKSGQPSTVHSGGQRGNVSNIEMKPNEQITQLSGTHAEYRHANGNRVISSLKIHTNLNPNGYGPYGEQTNVSNTSSFSSPPFNGTFSGLFAKSDGYLFSIGIFVVEQ